MLVGTELLANKCSLFANIYSNFIAKSFNMANEKTSKPVGTKASNLLRKKSSKKNVKSVAASALTQRPNKKGK